MQLIIPDPVSILDYMPSAYKILVYGQSGTGKTEFAATWAEAGTLLYMDTSQGMLTVKSSPRLTHKHNIFFNTIHDIADDPHIKRRIGWDILKSITESVRDTGKFGNCTPKTLVLDDLTVGAEYALTCALQIHNKSPEAEVTQPDWGKQIALIRNLINSARSIKGVNFICLAHEQFVQDKLSGRTWCLPLVTGKYANQVAGYFDEVYHTKVESIGGKQQFIMDLRPSGLIGVAKSRFDLPASVPTHYSSIKGSLEKLQQKREVSK